MDAKHQEAAGGGDRDLAGKRATGKRPRTEAVDLSLETPAAVRFFAAHELSRIIVVRMSEVLI